MKLRVLFAFLCSAVLVFSAANDIVVKKRTSAGNLLDYTIAVGNEGDTLTLTGGNPTWSASVTGATLNEISAAIADQAGIANGDWNIRWNWQKTTNSETAFEIGESAASTGGTSTAGVPNQVLAKFSTVAASTASPLASYVRGQHLFSVSPDSRQLLFTDGSASAPPVSFAGSKNTGFFASGSFLGVANNGSYHTTFSAFSEYGHLAASSNTTGYVLSNTALRAVISSSSDTITTTPLRTLFANASNPTTSTVSLLRSRGSIPTPTLITTGDDIGRVGGYAYVGDTNTFVEAANITFDSTGTIADTTTGVGGIIRFNTRASGGALTQALAIQGGSTPQLVAADGSSANPVYSFSNSTATGLWSPLAGVVAVATGSDMVRFNPSTIASGRISVTSSSGSYLANTVNFHALISGSSTDNTTAGLRATYHNSSNNSNAGMLSLMRSRGSAASPTTITSGDNLGSIKAYGYVGSTNKYVEAASVTVDSTGTISDSTTGVGGIIRLSARVSGSAIAEVANFSGTAFTQAAGQAYRVSSGTNQRAGNATLVAGTVTVNNTTVTANTIVMLTRKTAGGTLGNLTYTTSAATSFTINSDSATDTSVVSYFLIEVP